MDELARGVQDGEERARDVLDVHERAPRRSVALDEDLAGRVRIPNEVVHDHVGAQPRRGAVGGGVPQIGRGEGIVGELRDVPLGEHLRASVRRHGCELGVLVQHLVVARLAVEAARRREQEALDSGLLGLLGDAYRGEVVDVVGRLRVEVADGVVADRGEVDHGVEADEVLALDVADVPLQRLDLGRVRAEGARCEQVGVKPDDLVAGVLQHGDQHRADVAVVTGYECAQGNLLLDTG